MTLQQRIQQSATELGNLLRQAEKKHRRFLKRRDAEFFRKHYCPKRLFSEELPKPRDIWFPEGSPIGFSIVVPSDTDTRAITSAFVKAASQHNTQHALIADNGKPFKTIGIRRAKATHKLHSELTRQVYKALEQIDSKLNAVLEIHGTEAVFQNPASKIVFNIEISRVGNKFCNQVHYVIKAD